MVINGHDLILANPIKQMMTRKIQDHGVSWGLSEVGYDIRLKQDVLFARPTITHDMHHSIDGNGPQFGRFCIASAMEEFQMPLNIMGIVHDKSTWARQGLSVFNTVIEPGWNGFLTLELVYHGNGRLILPAGSGIAQVVFHSISYPTQYRGKYQNQADQPVESIFVDTNPPNRV